MNKLIKVSAVLLTVMFSVSGCNMENVKKFFTKPEENESVEEIEETGDVGEEETSVEPSEETANTETSESVEVTTEMITEVTTSETTEETTIEISENTTAVETAESTENTDYLNLYKKYIQTQDDAGSYKYCLYNIDNDGIPELIQDKSGYFIRIYSISEGKVVSLTDEEGWGYGAMGNYGYFIAGSGDEERLGNIYNYNADMAGAILNLTRIKLENGKFTENVTAQEVYFDDVNGNWMPDDDEEYLDKPKFYIDDKEVSGSEYTEYVYEEKNYMISAYLVGTMSYDEFMECSGPDTLPCFLTEIPDGEYSALLLDLQDEVATFSINPYIYDEEGNYTFSENGYVITDYEVEEFIQLDVSDAVLFSNFDVYNNTNFEDSDVVDSIDEYENAAMHIIVEKGKVTRIFGDIPQ